MKTETTLIWDGLLNSDRETLSIFIALFEDSKGLSLVSDKILDVKRKTQKLYESSFSKGEAQAIQNDLKDHFSQRIEKTAKTIHESDLSDEVLKTALWEHLLNALQLNSVRSQKTPPAERDPGIFLRGQTECAVSSLLPLPLGGFCQRV